jgi:hypothetical protein
LRQAAAPYPAETLGGTRRDFCVGAPGRHLRGYGAKNLHPLPKMAKRAVFSYLSADAPAAFWRVGGYLAAANKAFTSGVRML